MEQKMINKQKIQFTELKRFAEMNTKTQLQFNKTLSHLSMHILQNKHLEDAALREPSTPGINKRRRRRQLSISELHDKGRIEAISTTLYTLKTVWDKMAITNEELARISKKNIQGILTEEATAGGEG